MDQYEFDGSHLVIHDDELKLQFNESFRPLLVSETSLDDHVINIDLGGGHFLEKKGLRNGQTLLLYPDGSKKMECYYLEGNLHGPSTFFSELGQLLARSWFIRGKQVGKSFWYYPSGRLYSIQRYQNDHWHLKQEYFYESGQIKSILVFNQGKLDGGVILYSPEGKVERSIQFKDGKKL